MDIDSSLAIPNRSSGRDARIDLLRGGALALVWVDHFEDAAGLAVLSPWTLRAWGPSDAAELFVILSGLVVGRSYSSRMERTGLTSTLRHAIGRTAILYFGYVLAGIAVAYLASALGFTNNRVLIPDSLRGKDLSAAALGILTLDHAPLPLQILFLYLAWLPISPLLVWGLRRRFWWCLAISAAVYVVVQPVWSRMLEVPAGMTSAWYFDPRGWQFLFMLGLACGVRWHQNRHPITEPQAKTMDILHWVACIAAGVAICAGFFLRPEVTGTTSPLLESLSRPARNIVMALIDKRSLGPIRMIHSLAVVWLLFLAIPSSWRTAVPTWLGPVARCGRHSLFVYTSGAVLMLPCLRCAAASGGRWEAIGLIEFDALIVLALVAMGRSHWSARIASR